MPDRWNRGWYNRGQPFQFGRPLLQTLFEGESLLRTYVSWTIYGTLEAAHEPIFVGLQLLRYPSDGFAFPSNPAEGTNVGEAEWLALETHSPAVNHAPDLPASRTVYPRDGSRLWDIQANRRVDAGFIVDMYLIYALPVDASGGLLSSYTYSVLKRTPAP